MFSLPEEGPLEGRVLGEAVRHDSDRRFRNHVLHTVEEESNWAAAGGAMWATGTPEVPPGHLIVDSAAGQALIGETACVKWEQKLTGVGQVR